MKIEGFDLPEGKLSASLDELREEIASVKDWYETSKRSLDLIQKSSERKLKKSEAAMVARDFLAAGLLMATMTARNEDIVNAANRVIAEAVAPDVLAKFEELLKGEET